MASANIATDSNLENRVLNNYVETLNAYSTQIDTIAAATATSDHSYENDRPNYVHINEIEGDDPNIITETRVGILK